MSLPAELRNRIYEYCLPSPTRIPELPPSESIREDGETVAIKPGPEPPRFWFRAKQRSYRRSIELVESMTEEEAEQLQWSRYYQKTRWRRFGTGRGRSGPRFNPQTNDDDPSDSDQEEEIDTGPKIPALNILAVSKTIYEEAAPMFYSQHLIFADTDALFSFAARLSPRTARLLRHIEICIWTSTRTRKNRGYAAMAMLAAKGVTELETLHINCTMGYFHSYSWRNSRKEQAIPKRVARKVYRECYDWLEVMGGTHGDYARGVEVLRVRDDNLEGWLNSDKSGNGTQDEKMEAGLKMYRKELLRLVMSGV